MNEDTITIEVDGYGIKHFAKMSDISDATEFIEACAKMAESVGYAPSKVIEALKVAADARE